MSFPAYPDYRESGFQWLGRIPENWVSIPFGVLFRRTKRVGYADEELLSVYRDYGVIRKSDRDDNFNKASEDLSTYQLVEPGDLAMNKMKAWQGSLGISAHRGIVSPAYFVFAPKQEFHARFLHYLLRSPPYAAGYMTISKGIRINQWDVDPDHLSTLPVLFPSLDEQAAIAAFLDRETAKIDALVAEQEQLIALLREKRQAVISYAVTKGLNPDAPVKDSGIEWLGEIPARWAVSPLKYLVSFRSGGTPSKDNPDYWDGEIPWASAKDLKVELLSDTQDHLTQRAIDSGVAATVPAGAVVVLVRGMMLARLFPVCELAVPMTINQDCKALLPGSNITGSYLAWALRGTADETLNRLDEAGHGTKALRMEAWTSMELPVPPLNEQHDIVAHLTEATIRIDQLADEAQSAITLLQERRAALISATVTGKIDVRGVVSRSNVVSIESARPSSLPPLRAVVGAYAIRELGPMGRMAVMKAGYLAEGHAGFGDLNGRYERYAAGPYDQSLIAAMERGAGEISAIVTHEPQDEGKPVTYDVPKGYQPPSDALSALVGEDRARRFLALLSLLKGIGRDGVEAVATLYAVWNDLLAAGKAADADAICNGVLNDWHPEKAKKFKRVDLDHWLDWMRRNDLVPDGSAPRTDNQGSLFA